MNLFCSIGRKKGNGQSEIFQLCWQKVHKGRPVVWLLGNACKLDIGFQSDHLVFQVTEFGVFFFKVSLRSSWNSHFFFFFFSSLSVLSLKFYLSAFFLDFLFICVLLFFGFCLGFLWLYYLSTSQGLFFTLRALLLQFF